MTSEIDEAIAAFYSAFDNRDRRAPAADALRDMFIPEGRVTRVSSAGVESWTVDEFIAPRMKLLTDGSLLDFHEWETDAQTTVLNDIASRESQYSKSGTLNGAPYAGGGRKFIQLCRVGDRWLIASVLWQDY